MNAPGYEVSPPSLAEAARGIEDVLAGLRSFGAGVGQAEAGRGVAALGSGTGPVGHAGLAGAFGAFCARWEWGVRTVVRAGRELADGLDATALGYRAAEHAQGGLFQRIMLDVTGDQGAPGSRSPTGASIAGTWSGTAGDVAGNLGPAAVADALHGDNPLRGLLDDVADLHTIIE